MSGMEPGRPKIEWREAQYIWNGTRILNDHGVEFLVYEFCPYRDGTIVLRTSRRKNHVVHHGFILVKGTDLIRCRVEKEDQ